MMDPVTAAFGPPPAPPGSPADLLTVSLARDAARGDPTALKTVDLLRRQAKLGDGRAADRLRKFARASAQIMAEGGEPGADAPRSRAPIPAAGLTVGAPLLAPALPARAASGAPALPGVASADETPEPDMTLRPVEPRPQSRLPVLRPEALPDRLRPGAPATAQRWLTPAQRAYPEGSGMAPQVVPPARPEMSAPGAGSADFQLYGQAGYPQLPAAPRPAAQSAAEITAEALATAAPRVPGVPEIGAEMAQPAPQPFRFPGPAEPNAPRFPGAGIVARPDMAPAPGAANASWDVLPPAIAAAFGQTPPAEAPANGSGGVLPARPAGSPSAATAAAQPGATARQAGNGGARPTASAAPPSSPVTSAFSFIDAAGAPEAAPPDLTFSLGSTPEQRAAADTAGLAAAAGQRDALQTDFFRNLMAFGAATAAAADRPGASTFGSIGQGVGAAMNQAEQRRRVNLLEKREERQLAQGDRGLSIQERRAAADEKRAAGEETYRTAQLGLQQQQVDLAGRRLDQDFTFKTEELKLSRQRLGIEAFKASQDDYTVTSAGTSLVAVNKRTGTGRILEGADGKPISVDKVTEAQASTIAKGIAHDTAITKEGVKDDLGNVKEVTRTDQASYARNYNRIMKTFGFKGGMEEERKVVGGKTYVMIDGQWYER